MSNYQYDSFLDVVTAFSNGELDGYVLDVDFEWVCLLRKDGDFDRERDGHLWGGEQPNIILEKLLKNAGIPINE